jgi:hypothetical protein
LEYPVPERLYELADLGHLDKIRAYDEMIDEEWVWDWRLETFRDWWRLVEIQ